MKFFQYLLSFFIFLILALPCQASAFDVPKNPQGFVNDYANVLNQSNELEETLRNFSERTKYEVAIVTIDSLNEEPIEYVAEEIFNTWKIGDEKLDTGLLMLFAIEDRQSKIETGYGVEAIIPDLKAYQLLEIIKPFFREGDYDEGINAIVNDTLPLLENEVVYIPEESNFGNFGNLFFLLIGIFAWLSSVLGRSKSWWAGGVIGAVFSGILTLLGLVSWWGIIPITLFGLLFDYIVSKNYKSKKKTSWWAGGTRSHFFDSGSRSSGFGSGGFGGFGGGSSGGGGASSGW